MIRAFVAAIEHLADGPGGRPHPKRLAEPYVDPSRSDRESKTWPRDPAHTYFVMGDNRMDSCDSREWGTVPRGNLIGPVVATYWPFGRFGFL